MNTLLNKHNIVMFTALAALIILTLWMQFVLLDTSDEDSSFAQNNDPDYYVENLTLFGLGENGKEYQLEADRLVHFPEGNKSLLDKPHLIQTEDTAGPTHIYADSGWLFSDGTEILLTGNVKVIQSLNTDTGVQPGGASTTERMRIKLKPKNK